MNDGIAKKMGDRGFFHMMEKMMVNVDGVVQEVVCHGTFGDQLILSSPSWYGIQMVDIDKIRCRPYHPSFESIVNDESENQPPLHELSSEQDYCNHIGSLILKNYTIDQAFHDRVQTPPPV